MSATLKTIPLLSLFLSFVTNGYAQVVQPYQDDLKSRPVNRQQLSSSKMESYNFRDPFTITRVNSRGGNQLNTVEGKSNFFFRKCFFTTFHQQREPLNYLAHDQINQTMISLGLWDGENNISQGVIKLKLCTIERL